jgi:type I restriction enzyme S subunit
MSVIADVLTNNFDAWTSAIERKSTAGRGGSKKFRLYGIEKLRGLILDLAMRGKLVPPDPDDEPASELLKRIKAERRKLVATGEIGKARESSKPLLVPPYEIPRNWSWIQVSDVGHDWGQTTPTTSFTYIDVGSIDQRLGKVREPTVMDAASAPSRARKCVRNGTVIYSTVRPYLLNVAIIDQVFDPEPIASTAFAVVHPFTGVVPSFAYRYLRSPAFVAYVENCQLGIAYPAINDKQFFSAPFPLPPENEQQRIVAKVDELMALCDALEAGTYKAIEAHELLIETLLATLTNSQNAEELAENWARVETNFDTLFTTTASIHQLKQTILQLAIMGKLVPQDPTDEPASVSLKKIKTAGSNVAWQRKIRKIRQPGSGGGDTKLFKLPPGWQWATFPELGIFDRGKSKHRPRNDPKLFNPGVYPLVQTGEVARAEDLIREFHSEYSEIGLAQSKIWPKGTLCITIAANIADSAILDFDACFPDSVVGFIPLDPRMSPRYFLHFMKTAKDNLLKYAPSTAQKNINLSILESVQIPIPPLNEMKRIIDKVDQLIDLCRSLDARLFEAQRQQSQFADAVALRAVAEPLCA